MPKRKITSETWQAMSAAYDAWDGTISIEDLLKPWGISKQAFYAERRKQGLGLKSDRPVPQTADEKAIIEVLLSSLVEARIKIRELENELATRR